MNLGARNPLQILDLLHYHFGTQVLRAFIRNNVNLAEAPAHRTYISAYLRSSNGARDYARVAQKFETRLGTQQPADLPARRAGNA